MLTRALGQDSDLAYQFQLRAMELCRLCVIWERQVQPIPGGEDLNSWGPSEADKESCIINEFSASWTEDETESEGGGSNGSDDEGWADDNDEMEGELLESMEALVFSDEYRAEGQDDVFYYGQEFSQPADIHRRTSMSPKKRTRDD